MLLKKENMAKFLTDNTEISSDDFDGENSENYNEEN